MLDRIAALLALITLAAFLGVMIWRVPEVALIIVLGGGFLFAAADAFLTTRRQSQRQQDPPSDR